MLRQLLGRSLLTLLAGLTLTACELTPTPSSILAVRTPISQQTTVSKSIDNIRIRYVKEDFNGRVYDSNVLEVDWYKNLDCSPLQTKYERVARQIIVENIQTVLRKYPIVDVFKQGINYAKGPSMKVSLVYEVWPENPTFVRISTENEATLSKIGQEIYTGACLDPEHNTSS